MQSKVEIRTLGIAELKSFLTEIGEKTFRADQIFDWVWNKNAYSFDEMLNLSKPLRTTLSERFELNKVKVESFRKSSDGTIKYIFKLSDGQEVEGVLIPTKSRVTACISSQVGCSLSCTFCATGKMDLMRNLHFYEIFDQVAFFKQEAQDQYGRNLSNIVYMGMGEPLLNYKNVLKSAEMISDENALGMSPRRITVSSAGIAKLIRQLGDDEVRFEFALSLHAANDEKRNKIMAINESNSLDKLQDALNYFSEKTGQRITLEYIVMKDFNDTTQDAEQLAQFARSVKSKVNIIEYNPIEEGGYLNASPEKMDAFVAHLESRGVIVNVRRSRGKDIDGACGQLALKRKN